MKREKLRATHPIFAVRLPPDEKEWLDDQLKILKELVNQDKDPETKIINQNDIFIEVVRMGISRFRSKYKV